MSLDADRELRQRVYERTRDELVQRLFSNSEGYDRAVLTLSSALLGLSLAFISKIAPFKDAQLLGYLYTSWGALGLAIIATVISFRCSDCDIRRELDRAHRYYLENDEKARALSGRAVLTDLFNGLAGLSFIAGVVLTIVFAIGNVRGQAMANEQDPGNNSLAYDGQTITTMQKVVTPDFAKGQTLAPMQQIPQNQPTTTQPGDGGQPTQQPTTADQ